MNNPYFYQKRIVLIGLTFYTEDELTKAVDKLGGKIVTDTGDADLVIFGNKVRVKGISILEQNYPGALIQWEGKLNDLVPELDGGIEELF